MSFLSRSTSLFETNVLLVLVVLVHLLLELRVSDLTGESYLCTQAVAVSGPGSKSVLC